MKLSIFKKYFPVFLFLYHLLFAYVAWAYVTENNGDAFRYWFVGQDLSQKSWFSFFQPGTDVIKLITFPLVKYLQLPFWAGFLLFSLLSAVGILKLYFLLDKKAGESTLLKLLVAVLLLLPNLHFWTSVIGKEAVLILPILFILSEMAKKKFGSVVLWLSVLLLALIRPHVAFILLLSGVLSVLLVMKMTVQKKIALLGGLIATMTFLTFLLTRLQDFTGGFQRVLYKYEMHITHFKKTTAYVPLDEYPLPYKIFTFYFRPLPFEKKGLFYQVISLENFLLLGLFAVTLFLSVKYFRLLRKNLTFVYSIFFLFFFALMYVYAYANYGIIMRTRIMAIPFLYILIVEVLSTARSKTAQPSPDDHRLTTSTHCHINPLPMKLIRITTIPLSLDKLLGKQLTFMNQFYELTAVAADEDELARVADQYGVKHQVIEMTREISPLKDLLAVWHLYWFLRKEQPDIVHSHTPKAGIVGMMAAWLAGVPHRFHTVAGLPLLEATGLKRKILNAVETLTYRFATKVYPNSLGLHDIILKEGFCKPNQLKVIANGSSNGIDTTFFNTAHYSVVDHKTLRESLSILPDDFVFIFVGRLVGDKGINELIAAFSSLALPKVKLLLVGPYEDELDALKVETLEEIDRNTNIISTGFQQEVRPYFAIADALVFPSYREGFPNVVLQAGAMGLPSIVSDINGCNEIIEDGFNGLIIPVKNTNALADAMRRLHQDLLLYQKLQQQARPKIVANYEQQVVWQALLAEYKRSLNKDI